MTKVKITVVPTTNLPHADLAFAVHLYEQRFDAYADTERSDYTLDLMTIPHRSTTVGRQYAADTLLATALHHRAHGIGVVLTAADIYTRGTNYVFGLATQGAAVVSSARIDPAFWRGVPEIFSYTRRGRRFFERQYAKVLVHELGHAFGLPHCTDWNCAMHYSNSPTELFRKGDEYCQPCRRTFKASVPGRGAARGRSP